MHITSLSFGLFLIATVLVYYVIPDRYRWFSLLILSVYFYVASGTPIIYILISSVSIYYATIFLSKLGNSNGRKSILFLTLLLNLGILCLFKYANFIIEQVNRLFASGGRDISIEAVSLIAPLGISFYTFQATGYLLDVYRGEVDCEKNWLRLLLFMLFFPHITQGPIGDYKRLSKQFYEPKEFSIKKYTYGCERIIWGLFKKMVIADVLAVYVTEYFMQYELYVSIGLWIGMFMYSIQLYADFSGYMDIMCGFCEILGIKLDENFARPYLAENISEFWDRWHISLSNWLKKYIYIPLGGSRKGKVLRVINILIVFLISGMWHGSTTAYILWGLWHGTLSILPQRKLRKYIYKIINMCLTFLAVSFGWICFRLDNIGEVVSYIYRMFTKTNLQSISIHEIVPKYEGASTLLKFTICGMGIVLMLIVSIWQEKGSVRARISEMNVISRWGIYIYLAVGILIFGTGNGGEAFLYAKF